MITFETQEDFEEAVMSIIRNRLKVRVICGGEYAGFPVTVKLQDYNYSTFKRIDIDSDFDKP